MWPACSLVYFEWVTATLSGSVSSGDGINWTGIWRLSLPQRIHAFLWLAMRGGLLTNVERSRWHLTVDVVCSLYRQGS
ncbi:hypothetical protein V6N13_065704 [Hibiscus sabdariffa]